MENTLPLPATAAGAAMPPRRKTESNGQDQINPGEFMRQVQAKRARSYWPSRQETVTTAIFVGIMMMILAVFFLGIDSLFGMRRALAAVAGLIPASQLYRERRHMARWYIIHAYSGFENKVRESILSEAERMGLSQLVEAVEVPDRNDHRGQARQEGAGRTQVHAGLRSGQAGAERRRLSPRQEHRRR
jgi:preprotein translocase subunit SecE